MNDVKFNLAADVVSYIYDYNVALNNLRALRNKFRWPDVPIDVIKTRREKNIIKRALELGFVGTAKRKGKTSYTFLAEWLVVKEKIKNLPLEEQTFIHSINYNYHFESTKAKRLKLLSFSYLLSKLIDGMTEKTLAKHLNITPVHVSRLVNQCKKAGFIKVDTRYVCIANNVNSSEQIRYIKHRFMNGNLFLTKAKQLLSRIPNKYTLKVDVLETKHSLSYTTNKWLNSLYEQKCNIPRNKLAAIENAKLLSELYELNDRKRTRKLNLKPIPILSAKKLAPLLYNKIVPYRLNKNMIRLANIGIDTPALWDVSIDSLGEDFFLSEDEDDVSPIPNPILTRPLKIHKGNLSTISKRKLNFLNLVINNEKFIEKKFPNLDIVKQKEIAAQILGIPTSPSSAPLEDVQKEFELIALNIAERRVYEILSDAIIATAGKSSPTYNTLLSIKDKPIRFIISTLKEKHPLDLRNAIMLNEMTCSNSHNRELRERYILPLLKDLDSAAFSMVNKYYMTKEEITKSAEQAKNAILSSNNPRIYENIQRVILDHNLGTFINIEALELYNNPNLNKKLLEAAKPRCESPNANIGTYHASMEKTLADEALSDELRAKLAKALKLEQEEQEVDEVTERRVCYSEKEIRKNTLRMRFSIDVDVDTISEDVIKEMRQEGIDVDRRINKDALRRAIVKLKCGNIPEAKYFFSVLFLCCEKFGLEVKSIDEVCEFNDPLWERKLSSDLFKLVRGSEKLRIAVGEEMRRMWGVDKFQKGGSTMQPPKADVAMCTSVSEKSKEIFSFKKGKDGEGVLEHLDENSTAIPLQRFLRVNKEIGYYR